MSWLAANRRRGDVRRRALANVSSGERSRVVKSSKGLSPAFEHEQSRAARQRACNGRSYSDPGRPLFDRRQDPSGLTRAAKGRPACSVADLHRAQRQRVATARLAELASPSDSTNRAPCIKRPRRYAPPNRLRARYRVSLCSWEGRSAHRMSAEQHGSLGRDTRQHYVLRLRLLEVYSRRKPAADVIREARANMLRRSP